MTPKTLLAVLALLLVVAMAGYFHFQRDVIEAPFAASSNSQSAPPEQEADSSLAASPPESEATGSGTDEDEPPKEYLTDWRGNQVEVETVFGRKVKKERNCTFRVNGYTTHEDGTTSAIRECVPNEPKPIDIYNTYSNEELEVLSYSDPRAAYNLSLRLRDRDYPQALQYSLRTAALSGDIKGLALMSVYIPYSAKKDGKWNLKYYEEQYVLSEIARAVDPGSKMKGSIPREAIEQEGANFNLEALDARVAEHLKTIENIRSEVGID